MRGFQRLGDLFGYRQRVFDGDRAVRDAVGQGGPFDEFEYQGPGTLRLLNPVDLRDVRMIKAGQDLRFPLKPGETVRVFRERVREDLQRHLAVELRVGSLPHLSHAALANQGGHRVVPETGAGAQGHGGL